MNKLEDKSSETTQTFDPIITSLDFLRNPVFIPSFDTPEAYDGQFMVNGKVKVSLKGPALKANEADLFHALVHTAKMQKFARHEVYFVMNDLLKLMRWERDGNNYARLKKSIDTFLEVGIEMEGVLPKQGKRSRRWQILTGRELYSGTSKGQDTLFRSWVRFSDEMLDLFRSGALKAVHPVYFELGSPLEKRVFGLLSVRSSDLEYWDVQLLKLRELLPLTGKTYRHPSKIWDTLKRTLQRLKTRGVIHDFERQNETVPMLRIWPNHDFFVSAKKRLTLMNGKASIESKSEGVLPVGGGHPDEGAAEENAKLIKVLIERGVSGKVAKILISKADQTKETVHKQLAHLDYLKAHNRAPEDPAAWLVDAIRENYALPVGAKPKVDDAHRREVAAILQKAEEHFKNGDNEAAAQYAESCLARVADKRAAEIMAEAKARIAGSERLVALRAQLSEDEMDVLRALAWSRVVEAVKRPLQDIEQMKIYQDFCDDKLDELVVERLGAA